MTDGVNEIVIPTKVVNKLTEPFYDTSAFHHANTYLYIKIYYARFNIDFPGRNVWCVYFWFLIIVIIAI